MRRAIVGGVVMLMLTASLVVATGPDNLMFSNPQTDPPNSTWAKEQVRRVNNCKPPCAGGAVATATNTVAGPTNTATRTPTPASTATAVATLTPVVFINGGTSNETCADSGDGARGTLTFSPSSSLVRVTNNDPDGCDVTLGEAGAAQGYFVWIQNVSSPNLRFASQAGVLVLPHDVFFVELEYTLQLKYDNGQWVQIGANDPSTVLQSAHLITDPGDIPASYATSTTECQSICTNLTGDNDVIYAFPTGDQPHLIQFRDRACQCEGTGIEVGDVLTVSDSGCIVVGRTITCDNGGIALGNTIGVDNGSVAIGANIGNCDGNNDTCIGLKAESTGDGNVNIGEDNSAAGDCAMTGFESVSIGRKDCGAGIDLTGDRVVHIGEGPISLDGDHTICLGSGVECDVDNGIGIGEDANPDGGICLGKSCVGTATDWVIGSASQQLHPVFVSASPTLSGGCGTGPTLPGAAKDVAGTITLGTTPTACVLNFGATWTNIPSCFANNETSNLFVSVTTSTTQITFTGVLATGDVIRWGCPVS